METSPIISLSDELRLLYPRWEIVIGIPSGDGWIQGDDLQTAQEGPFNSLLIRIGQAMNSPDRRTIAGSFALRYGWSFGLAIAPFVLHRLVPWIALENVSFRFNEKGWFVGVALHEPKAKMLDSSDRPTHPSCGQTCDENDLREWLRESMTRQACPIVDALHQWSGFSRKGLWGLIASSWGSQFCNVWGMNGDAEARIQFLRQFFEGDDPVSRGRPDFYPVTLGDVTRIYQRRSTCCRYYRLPEKHYCTSCPLVSQEERLRRNVEWLKRLLEAPQATTV